MLPEPEKADCPSAKYPYKSIAYKNSKITYNYPYKKDPSFNFAQLQAIARSL